MAYFYKIKTEENKKEKLDTIPRVLVFRFLGKPLIFKTMFIAVGSAVLLLSIV